MKDIYLAVRNTILFYFIALLLGSSIAMPQSFSEKFFVGLFFGIAITLIPHILKFFKLPVNTGSVLLLCIIISFIFFVTASYMLSLIDFTSKLPDLFTFMGLTASADNLMSIVYATIIASLVVVGFDTLEKNA